MKTQIKDELETYLNEPVAPGPDPVKNSPGIDTLTYWKHNEYRFPVLARMARDYLCIQGTSTSVERLFSAAGNVITEKRNRIGAQTASALLCLGSWYKEQELKEDPIESPRNEGELEKDVVIVDD